MIRLIACLMFATLAACSSNAAKYRAADDQILCSMQGQAFQVEKNVGDTSLVKRLPQADSLCKKSVTL